MSDDQHRIAVRRKFAGKGISTSLLSWAVDRASVLARSYLRLDCEADRIPLRAIYERFGFQFHSYRKVGPYFVARYEYPIRYDVQVIQAFDTESTEPGRQGLIERAVTEGNAYVVEQEDVVIAIGILEYTFFEQGFISLIYVKGQERPTGAGEMLSRHLISICRTPKLFSSTNRSNLPMQALLLKTGFAESGIVHNLDAGDPEVIYYQEVVPKTREIAEIS